MEKLETLLHRLASIGINLELHSNYPWMYIDKINGEKIFETFQSEYGFVIGYYPIKIDQEFKFTNLKEIFNLIRKYERATK